MILTKDQLQSITLGAERVEQQDDCIHFYRFTTEQDALYQQRGSALYLKSLGTSGIQLRFLTDSQSLFLSTVITPGSSRTYFAFEVFANGKQIGTLDNYAGKSMTGVYTTSVYPQGEFSRTFDLGVGEKEISIYFPWSVHAAIKTLALDDGASVIPVKPKKTMLCFGDSITQGYDALYPSRKYITRLAELLDAQEYNKAIGGEVFCPELASTKENFVPDYVTVAYGTNDCARGNMDDFINNCKGFLKNVNKNYPNSKVFVITPIWCKAPSETSTLAQLEKWGQVIEEQAKEFENISVISGYGFVPQDENFFGDGHLHPNDQGFDFYFENLSKAVAL